MMMNVTEMKGTARGWFVGPKKKKKKKDFGSFRINMKPLLDTGAEDRVCRSTFQRESQG